MIEKLVSKRSWIAINAGILLCAAAVPSAVLAQTGGAPAPATSGKVQAATSGASLPVHNAQTATAPQSTSPQDVFPPGNNGQPIPCSVLPNHKGEPEVFHVGGDPAAPLASIPFPLGTAIHPGDVVGVKYTDETPLNGGGSPPGHAGVPLIPPLFTLDGVQVPTITFTLDSTAGQNGTDLTIQLSTTEPPGVHKIDIDGWDTDQNKGGDCAHIEMMFTVTAPTFTINKTVTDSTGASINGKTVTKGTQLHYTVTVTNNSTVAGVPSGPVTDVITKLDLSQFTVDATPAASQGTVTDTSTSTQRSWSWSLGTTLLPANVGTATLSIPVTVNGEGVEIDNSACLPGANACPNPCHASPTCTPCPSASNTPDAVTVCNFTWLLKKDVLNAAPPGGTSINGQSVALNTKLYYVVTVTNPGTTASDPGVITDDLSGFPTADYKVDQQPMDVSTQGAGAITGSGPGPWTWHPLNVPAGGTATLTLVVEPITAAAGPLTNTACLPGPAQTADCKSVNNFTPKFSIDKGVFDDSGAPINGKLIASGTTLHYVVTVTNNGTGDGDPGSPTPISDKITKIDPSLFSIVSGPTGPGTITNLGGGSFSWDPNTITANGGTAKLELVVKVVATKGEIDNSACLPGAAACPTPCPAAGSCPGPCASTQNTADSVTVCNFLPPTVTLAKCIVTTTDCVNTTTQAPGNTVTYRVTATNPAANTANASNVLVDDVVTTPDNLPFIVNDGVNLGSNNLVTTNSFQGSPVVTVTKAGANHYQWTFATLTPGQSGVVTFTITIGVPTAPAAGTSETLHVDNTASEPTFKPPSVTVHSNVPLTGGVLACTTTTCPPATPKTGTELNLRIASGFFVSGLFLILFGLVSRPRRRRPA